MGRDLVDSGLLREWQELLKQLGPDGPLTPQPQGADANDLSEIPGSLESTSPAKRDVKPHGTENPEARAKLVPMNPAEQPDAAGNAGFERERLQELLRQVGFESLCLPSNGVLSPQWRAFLDRLGPTNTKTGKGKGTKTTR